MDLRITKIPKVFRQSEKGELFRECIMCNRELAKAGLDYLVEKVIRNHLTLGKKEVLFEYAMCFGCAMKMRTELSEESRQRIDQYFAGHINESQRRQRLEKNPNHVTRWISHCLVKGTPLTKSREYSMYAHCRGSQLVYSTLPYALSGEVMDEVMNLLSNKSLGVLDDFMGKHFSGPPEVREILKRRPLLV